MMKNEGCDIKSLNRSLKLIMVIIELVFIVLLIYGVSIDRNAVIGAGALSFILFLISIKRMPTLIRDLLLMQLMVAITIILSMFVYIQVSPLAF